VEESSIGLTEQARSVGSGLEPIWVLIPVKAKPYQVLMPDGIKLFQTFTISDVF
jgi:hypothetical protein